MDRLVEYVSSQLDATKDDLKTSLSAVDATVDSKLSHLKLELVSFIQSGVIDCIRAQTKNQHWRVETVYVPLSPNQQLLSDSVLPDAKCSTKFVQGVPPPLHSATAADEVFADITFASVHSATIPLRVPNHVQPNASTALTTSSNVDSSLLHKIDNTQQNNLSLFPQTKEILEKLPVATVKNEAQLGTISSRSALSGRVYEHSMLDEMENSRRLLMQSSNAINILQKKYDILQVEYSEFKMNANKSLEDKERELAQIEHSSRVRIEQLEARQRELTAEIETYLRLLLKARKAKHDAEIDSMAKFNALQFEYSEFKMSANKSLEEKLQLIKSLQPTLRDGELNIKIEPEDSVVVNQSLNRILHPILPNMGEHSLLSTVSNRENAFDNVANSQIDNEGDENNLGTRMFGTKRKEPQNDVECEGEKKGKIKNELDDSNPEMEDARCNTYWSTVFVNCADKNCPIKLDSIPQLYEHLRINHGFNGSPQFKRQFGKRDCPYCDNCPKSSKSLITHWNNFHLTGQFRCLVCNKKSDTVQKVYDHLSSKCATELFRSKKFRCTLDDCCQMFSDESQLSTHKSVHHEVIARPFECTFKVLSNSECGQCFTNRRLALIHIIGQHLGMSHEKALNSLTEHINEPDPNEYVRVNPN